MLRGSHIIFSVPTIKLILSLIKTYVVKVIIGYTAWPSMLPIQYICKITTGSSTDKKEEVAATRIKITQIVTQRLKETATKHAYSLITLYFFNSMFVVVVVLCSVIAEIRR